MHPVTVHKEMKNDTGATTPHCSFMHGNSCSVSMMLKLPNIILPQQF